MVILSNSWAQHLGSIARNDDTNKNMKAFTEALAPSKTITEQHNALVEEVDAAVLLVGSKNFVQQTHSWTKFGGTRSRPKIFIACLISVGPRATAVFINDNQAISLQTFYIPAATEIAACKSVNNFAKLTATTSTWAGTAANTTTPSTAPTPTAMSAPTTEDETETNATAASPPRRPTRQSAGTRMAAAAMPNQETSNTPVDADAPSLLIATPMRG